jgi:hypothetical protein
MSSPEAFGQAVHVLQQRVHHRLEERVGGRTEALRVVAHALDNAQPAGFDTTRAVRLADEILLASEYTISEEPQPDSGDPT